MADPQCKINCRVLNVAAGNKHLVFELAGTKKVVGELQIKTVDLTYLPVISQLFSQWVSMTQVHSLQRALSLVDRGVLKSLNGH